MKRINLLTFNRALSYGAVMQTFAMARVLESLGYEVEIIDFQAPFLPPKPTGIWTLKTYYNITRLRKELLFRSFHKKYLKNKTSAIYTSKSLFKGKFNADYYVVGSDQVWNPDITKRHGKRFFLDFVEGKKIAYAASFGKSTWEHSISFTEEISSLLKQFHAISVRENQGLELLKMRFQTNGCVVLDPTFLLDNYSEITKEVVLKDRIVCFQVNSNQEFIGLADLIQRKIGSPAYSLGSKVKYGSIIPRPFISVQDWLRFFAESSLIITDSFHGVIFSIVFKKEFLVINTNPTRFGRIGDLLSLLDLTERIIDHDSLSKDLKWNDQIDYLKVYEKLEAEKRHSLDFLIASLT